MIEPNYDKILKDKIDYYGETKAAYEFAAYEYNKQYIELNKLSIQLVSCFSAEQMEEAYRDGQYDSEEGKGNKFDINNYS